jgi:hypothetical protein
MPGCVLLYVIRSFRNELSKIFLLHARSVCPHVTTRELMKGFPLNLILGRFLPTPVDKFQLWLKLNKNNGHFAWRPTCFSDRIARKMCNGEKNISKNVCTEKIKPAF